ncbi:MAG: GlcNAc-transferase family protein [Chthoniobacter sp.]
MSLIFISIAAYRDPELMPTLRSCLERAAEPGSLRFCICWQHSDQDDWDGLCPYSGDDRFQIIDVPHEKARGVCWARHEIQKRYGGERYYLQLDSHHRFIEGWDEKLKGMLEGLREQGYEKPLLTGYLPPYQPGAGRELNGGSYVYSLNVDRFLPEGVAFLMPHTVPQTARLEGPFRTRFVSGHFIFTLGGFATEVPYDPRLYFHGEESSLAARAYTHGYDLFSPHRPVIWHEYIRQGKAKHWGDCVEWPQRNSRSYARYRELFRMDGTSREPGSLGEFDFGTDRSLADYERYAGIRFRDRRIHKETLRGDFPPLRSDFESGLTNRIKVCIDVWKEAVPESDYDFWAVALLDKAGADIYRQDCNEMEIRTLLRTAPGDRFIHIWRTFHHDQLPHMSRVWPHSKSKGWMDRIEQVIPYA